MPTGVVAAPVTYSIGGEQYVAIVAGTGGAVPIARRTDEPPRVMPNGRVLAFKLGATGALEFKDHWAPMPAVTTERFGNDQIARGRDLYFGGCSVCHGGYIVPDLRRSATIQNRDAFKAIVLDGALADRGMASWKTYLTPPQVEDIRAYVNDEARKLAAEEKTKSAAAR